MRNLISLCICTLAICLFFSCAGIFQQQIDIPEDALEWSFERKISWDDFKGEPIIKDGNIVSEISVLNPAFFNKPHIFLPTNIKVFCYMDRKNSWADKSKVTDQLLLYNQTIFDIYELYTRKLKKKLSETKFGIDPSNLFAQIVQENNDELRKYSKNIKLNRRRE